MTKTELINAIAAQDETGFSRRDIDALVSAVFDEITIALTNGDRVEIRGFGTFSVRERPARIGRNPRSGGSVRIPAKTVPVFKAGKPLRDAVNG